MIENKELRIGNIVTDEFYDSFKTTIQVESTYHKDVIDEYFRLQEDCSKASMARINATLNTIYDRFPPKNNKTK